MKPEKDLFLQVKDKSYIFNFKDATEEKKIGQILIDYLDMFDCYDIVNLLSSYPAKNTVLDDENIYIFCDWLTNNLKKNFGLAFPIIIKNFILKFFNLWKDNKKNFLDMLIRKIEIVKKYSNSDDELGFDLKSIKLENINMHYMLLFLPFYLFYEYILIQTIIKGTFLSTKHPFHISSPTFDSKIVLQEGTTEVQKISLKIVLEDDDFKQYYLLEGFHSYKLFEVYNIIEKEIKIKTCKNCGKYFIIENRSDTKYCDRISPEDKTKTCKEYGGIRKYQDNLKTNEAMGLARKIYMAKQMMVKRNPDIDNYRKDFENYKIQSKEWKKEVKAGSKTNEEYIQWLKDIKEKKA